MRGTALVSHLSLWPLFVLTVTKVMLAKSVNQTVMCLHANSPTTGHNLSIYHQHVSDHIANVHEIPSQSTQQQQFPITNPSTTLFCQLNQPVPPRTSMDILQHAHLSIWQCQGARKVQEARTKVWELWWQFVIAAKSKHAVFYFPKPYTDSWGWNNVRMALWGTSDLKLSWFSQNGQSGFI